MLIAAAVLLWSVSAAVALWAVVVCVECTAALLPSAPTPSRPRRGSCGVIVPARNEAATIGACLNALRPQLRSGDRLLVVADNCTDTTADVAQQHGAEVIERRDPQRPGKGHALAYGVAALASAPPDVVLAIDTDSVADTDLVDVLVARVLDCGRPVQARYVLRPPPDAGARDMLSALAFLIKNAVRPRGLQRLGLPCSLTGSGMAFPWPVLHTARLAHGSTAEDMRLGADLALAGHAPVACSETGVTGPLLGGAAANPQRTRWEHGHLETLLTYVPRLLRAAVTTQRPALLALALDLSVPPLSLLVVLWVVALCGATLARVCGWPGPLWVVILSGGLLLSGIGSAWIRFGRTISPLSVLMRAPLYIAWRLPQYLAFVTRRQSVWPPVPRDQP